jgi:hypothetical protein
VNFSKLFKFYVLKPKSSLSLLLSPYTTLIRVENGQRQIEPIMSLKMRVVVENLTGTLFYIQVRNDATLADLKREIEA